MPTDRVPSLRHADGLAREGKLAEAIAEYTRILEDHPHDWNVRNLLGDLHVKTGNVSAALQQFASGAEILARDGFLSKAAALYKKILKLQPDADDALMQAGELAARQMLIADARGYFAAAATKRRQRGDHRGALAAIVRIGSLDASDVAARLEASRARVELEDIPGALDELTSLADMLLQQDRPDEALAPLRELTKLNPGNAAVAGIIRLLDARRHADAKVAIAALVVRDPAPAVSTPEPARPAAAPAIATTTAANVDGEPEAGGDNRASDATRGDELDAVFARLRDEAARRPADEAANVAFTRGMALFNAGDYPHAAEQLRAAARSPQVRFRAASLLAQLFEQQRRTAEAIEWLGRAVDAPAPAPEDRCEALLKLARMLEDAGERDRALAVCLELRAAAGEYKDVEIRIARLADQQAGG